MSVSVLEVRCSTWCGLCCILQTSVSNLFKHPVSFNKDGLSSHSVFELLFCLTLVLSNSQITWCCKGILQMSAGNLEKPRKGAAWKVSHAWRLNTATEVWPKPGFTCSYLLLVPPVRFSWPTQTHSILGSKSFEHRHSFFCCILTLWSPVKSGMDNIAHQTTRDQHSIYMNKAYEINSKYVWEPLNKVIEFALL